MVKMSGYKCMTKHGKKVRDSANFRYYNPKKTIFSFLFHEFCICSEMTRRKNPSNLKRDSNDLVFSTINKSHNLHPFMKTLDWQLMYRSCNFFSKKIFTNYFPLAASRMSINLLKFFNKILI